MAKAGEVRVSISRWACGEAAQWLSTVYLPHYVSRPRLLGRVDTAHIDCLTTLATVLAKAARRSRQKQVFTVILSRKALAEFVRAVHGRTMEKSPDVPAPASSESCLTLNQTANAMREAAKSKKGRRKLSRPATKDRASGRFAVGDRQKQRAVQVERENETWDGFLKAGGALLGSKVPLPEIRPKKRRGQTD